MAKSEKEQSYCEGIEIEKFIGCCTAKCAIVYTWCILSSDFLRSSNAKYANRNRKQKQSALEMLNIRAVGMFAAVRSDNLPVKHWE